MVNLPSVLLPLSLALLICSAASDPRFPVPEISPWKASPASRVAFAPSSAPSARTSAVTVQLGNAKTRETSVCLELELPSEPSFSLELEWRASWRFLQGEGGQRPHSQFFLRVFRSDR